MSWLKRLFCRHRNTRKYYMDDILKHMPHAYIYTLCRDCGRSTHSEPVHNVTARMDAARWLEG